MRRVEPQVFVVAETHTDEVGMRDYLRHVGAQHSVFDPSDAALDSDCERLAEFMGRLCYRSWEPGLNANVTRVREGNGKYLANVISVKHGSVLEHSSASFIFADVSRVFTHELVRHRVGVGISQESLRFVRLDDLGLHVPSCIEANESVSVSCAECGGMGWVVIDDAGGTDKCPGCEGRRVVTPNRRFEQEFERAEQGQREMAEAFKLDDPGVPFDRKKEITSAMRRIAPDGLATTIGWTANMRTLRFVLALRTHRSVEEEIRLVFDKVGTCAVQRWPNLFQDFTREVVNGIGEWTSPNWKI